MSELTPQLRYTVLTEADLQAFSEFNCGDEPWSEELNGFLRENAFTEGRERLNTTYVFYDGMDAPVAYVTLATQTLALRTNSWLHLKSQYGHVPMLLIGRLAVDARHQRRGVGRLVLAQVRTWAYEEACSPRLVGLHVDRSNTQAIAFYARHGFDVTPAPGRMLLMVYDLGTRE